MTDTNRRVHPVSDKQMQALIVKLTTRSEKERISATRTLGESGDPRAVPALVVASKDESATALVHFHASYALGTIRNPQAVPALMEALRDKEIDRFTRRNIIAALAAIGDPQAASSLISSLTGEDADARILAVTALGAWKSKAAVPALMAALTDKASETTYDIGENGARYNFVTQYVCDEAATALGRIGDARAVPALSEAWRDETSYSHTRQRAIKALGEIGGAFAAHSLTEALDSAEHGTEAVKALAMIGLPASSALLEALRREDRPFRKLWTQLTWPLPPTRICRCPPLRCRQISKLCPGQPLPLKMSPAAILWPRHLDFGRACSAGETMTERGER